MIRNLLLFVVFSFFSASAWAYEFCQPFSITITADMLQQQGADASGSVSLSGQSCTTIGSGGTQASTRGDLTATYNNFSYNSGLYYIDGTFNLTYETSVDTGSGAGAVTLTYSGGPVTYVTPNEQYTVIYNNVVLEYDSYGQYLNMSGTITVNGVEYSVDGLDPSLFRVM